VAEKRTRRVRRPSLEVVGEREILSPEELAMLLK
jgi:hypothetical protein